MFIRSVLIQFWPLFVLPVFLVLLLVSVQSLLAAVLVQFVMAEGYQESEVLKCIFCFKREERERLIYLVFLGQIQGEFLVAQGEEAANYFGVVPLVGRLLREHEMGQL
jgi:hypothetical protein